MKIPRVIRIEPSAKCNLSCRHCPTGTVEMARGVMSSEVFERCLKFIKYDEVKVVVLYHGGEPLLNKHFYSMANRIKKIRKDILLKTVSNGVALTKTNSKKLISSGIDEIEFSLDGLSFVENDYIRIGGGGEGVISNINHLLDEKQILHSEKPKVFISTTQFTRDIDHAKKVASFDCEPSQVPKYLTKAFPQSENKIEGFKAGYAIHWPHMGNIKDSFLIYLDERGKINNECDHLDNTVTIRWNGDVVPCCYDLTSKLVMGNILEDDLVDIVNGDRYSILKESIESKNFISICKECAVVTPKRYLIPKW